MDMGWRLLVGGLTATIALLGAGAVPRRAAGGPAPFAVLREFTVARTAGIAASPAMSGRTVVWVQTRGPLQRESVYPSLYGADLATRRVFRLPIPGQVVSPPFDPPSPAIDGDLVVWMGCHVCNEPGLAVFPTHTTIYMANLHTLQVRTVSAGAGSQVFPAVSGQVIVWLAEADGRQRLYGRDLATGRGFAPFYRSQLQLSASISGPIVVWAEASPTAPDAWAIVGANIRTGRTFVVTTSAQQPPTCHETPRGIVPLIGGRIVLWTRACGDESFAIEAKDLATGRTFEVARLPAGRLNPQFGPHLAFDGRIVVWDQARHGRFTTADDVDIYAADIVTGRQLRVTRDPGPHAWLAISGHIVVWTSGHAIRGALLSA